MLSCLYTVINNISIHLVLVENNKLGYNKNQVNDLGYLYFSHEAMEMSKRNTAPPEFTAEDVQFLQQGLTALQAVLDVAHQPIPSRLEHLRRQLQRWENAGSESWPQHDTM